MRSKNWFGIGPVADGILLMGWIICNMDLVSINARFGRGRKLKIEIGGGVSDQTSTKRWVLSLDSGLIPQLDVTTYLKDWHNPG